MAENSGESSPKPERVIAPPKYEDTGAFNNWLDKYVEKPDLSHADRKRSDGTAFTEKEQIQLTKDQLIQVAKNFPKMGKPPDLIRQVLIGAVEGLQKDFPEEHK